MKNTFLIIAGMGLLFTINSCAPVYRCGEEKPVGGIQGSNRLIDVVEERDDLCETVKVKDEENNFLVKKNQELSMENKALDKRNKELETNYAVLDEKHTQLKEDHLQLQENYSDQLTDNLQQGNLYDERIKEKERRLDQRAGELAQREQKIHQLEDKIYRQDSITNRLNQLIKDGLTGFNSDELTTEVKDGKVYVLMSDKLMFQSGKANVEPKGKEALEVLARVLKKNEEFQISVEGHTDNVPIKTSKYADNWDLSVARATSMVRLLQDDHSINPQRLTAAGKGEYEPKASNDTAEGRAKNRRTEIILSPDLSAVMDYLNK